MAFNLLCLSAVKKASYVHETIYFHRVVRRSEGLSYKPNCLRLAYDTLKVYEEIIQNNYPNDEKMNELLEYRKLWELLYCVVLDSAHPDNPKPYQQRKSDFRALMRNNYITDALQLKNLLKLSIKHRVLGELIYVRAFLVICMINKIRYIRGAVF